MQALASCVSPRRTFITMRTWSRLRRGRRLQSLDLDLGRVADFEPRSVEKLLADAQGEHPSARRDVNDGESGRCLRPEVADPAPGLPTHALGGEGEIRTLDGPVTHNGFR